MVIKSAIDNLKEKDKDDKKAVAGGIAITVMVLLFLAWGFYFIKKIQRGGQDLHLGGSAQDEFNFSNVRQAQEDLMKGFSNEDELREVRQQNTSSQYQGGGSSDPYYDISDDQFGGQGTIE